MWYNDDDDDDDDKNGIGDDRNLEAGDYDLGEAGARIGEHNEDPSL